ncbi:exo-beta-N-acetylmuramidase NamZ domain-containing protein [Brevibacillus borstelensis]|uniref:exo-beta-N-acetylmuramidase NamZ domain-containing protein n=1 Tax=Brevibacillus borstelensis TaxID=45462 RepID=UPI0030BD6510
MKRFIPFLILVLILTIIPPGGSFANATAVLLGSDMLFDQFHQVITGKKVGLVTNQTGVNSQGISTIDLLRRNKSVTLAALYTPEHGLDGKTPAGNYVASYKHPVYGIPVYSLYGSTRKPTKQMLADIDLLLVDLQDIGARTYTYISTLQYCMAAAKEQGKPIIVLDRPNPVGGTIVEGPVLEAAYRSFVGVDTLPMAHGMTIGELAQFFNRNIGASLTVIPMKGYTRHMLFQDTGLQWIPSSPRIPDLVAVFGYMATGLGEGSGIVQADNFRWIGGPGIDSNKYADLLNGALLPGVVFLPETKDSKGGVRLEITNPHQFNPAKTGIYALAYARQLSQFKVPKSGKTKVMFDLVMGTNKIGQYLEQGLSPKQIEERYASDLEAFRKLRSHYLIYSDTPYMPVQPIQSKPGIAQTKPEAPEQLPGPAKPEAQTPSSNRPISSPPAAGPVSESSGSAGLPGGPQQAGTEQQNPGTKPAVPVKPSASQTPAKPESSQVQEKVAYLTFDDGPSPITTEVLDILKAHDVKATFFVVGKSVPGHEAILKRAIADGHVVGGHTYSHNYRTIYKDLPSFFADLEKGNQLIEKATGIKPTVFRYPGGSTNTVSKTYQNAALYNNQHTVMSAIKTEAAKRGYAFIDWNITNGDARSNKYTPENALANIKAQVRNQKEIVVLMHDAATKSSTAKSLPAVIQFLKEHGYRFETIHADKATVATVK